MDKTLNGFDTHQIQNQCLFLIVNFEITFLVGFMDNTFRLLKHIKTNRKSLSSALF